MAEEAGDSVGVAIARLCEQVERLSLAIQMGDQRDLNTLISSAKKVVELCRQSTDSIQRFWALGNAPIHVLLAFIWTNTPSTKSKEEFWLGLLDKLNEEDPKGAASIRYTIQAVRAGLELDVEDGTPLAEKVINENGGGDHQALMTAHWVAACNREVQERLHGRKASLGSNGCFRARDASVAFPGHSRTGYPPYLARSALRVSSSRNSQGFFYLLC